MAFDFPSSPSVGQQYTPAGGPTYTWGGTAWTVSPIAIPDAPSDGMEYTRVNGVWRPVRQVLQVSATTNSIKLPFPSYAKGMRVRAQLWQPAAAVYHVIQFGVSPGVPITAPASYVSNLVYHSPAIASPYSGVVGGSNIYPGVLLGPSRSNVSVPVILDIDIVFENPAGGLFTAMARSGGYDTASYVTAETYGYCNTGAARATDVWLNSSIAAGILAGSTVVVGWY